jgi:hypothetical protein
MDADISCLKCIKEKGFEFISKNKNKTNDCNSNYLNYNSLTWENLIKKIFQIENKDIKIGGKIKKTRRNNKNKKSRRSKRRYK